MKNLLMIVPPQVHLLDINGPAHVFYEAKGYGAALNLHFVSIDQSPEIRSSAGLSFSKLIPFDQFDLEEGDFIFIPGFDYEILSDRKFLKKNQPFLDWLKEQYKKGASICSVCTGALLLAETGILNDKPCTTHWKYFSEFRKRFQKVKLEENRLFTIHDRLYTSAGVSSGIDLALFLLEQNYGAKFTADIAKEVVLYFRRNELDPQLNIYLQPGVEILDFAGPMEVFAQAGFKIYTVSKTKEPIRSQGILKFIPDYDISDAPKADILAFFGGNGRVSFNDDEVIDWIKKQKNIDYYFSVCTGVFALAESGILNGKSATTFHLSLSSLESDYPKIKVERKARFVDNGNVITTAGISAGIDGALHLVAKLRSYEAAKRIAKHIEYDKWVPKEELILSDDSPYIGRE